MNSTQNGLGWIVTTATKDCTLADILFQTKGGLEPDEILGWFDQAWEANQIALQELERAGATS